MQNNATIEEDRIKIVSNLELRLTGANYLTRVRY
jgi:hypothetical protein